MKIIVYPPKTEDGIRELRKRVAQVHAQAVLTYINKQLSCPKEQKQQLIKDIIKQG